MGCEFNKKIIEFDKAIDNIIESEKINFEEIPEDEFLCPDCGRVPIILKLYTDNSKVKYKCNCGKKEILIKDYYKDTIESEYKYLKTVCCKCDIRQEKNKDIYLYCYDCKDSFCPECFKVDRDEHSSNHSSVKVNEKNNYCLEHRKKFSYFCNNCNINICEDDKILHESHELINLLKFNKEFLENKKKFIKDKKRYLSDLIALNEIILNTGETLSDNYFHMKSVINLGKSINDENLRDSKDIDYIFNKLSIGIKESIEAIEKLENKKGITLKRKQQFLNLDNKVLEDDEFLLISKIKFNQLKKIDVSENKIKIIKPLDDMSLPFLEFLNMSHNQIKNIEPIAKLKSKKIKEIFLHNNKIKKIDAFLDSEFPYLEILRIEENEGIDFNSAEFQKLSQKKFKNKIIIKSKVDDFQKKYGVKIEENVKKIDLTDKKGGDEMLKDLYLIITYKTKNEIKELKLRNNQIKDPSILSRIQFPKLQTLDLTLNNIKNLKFLEGMKFDNLINLFLDNNKLNNICSLLKLKCKNLKAISLNDNLDNGEIKNSPILRDLRKNNKNIEIQLVKNEFFEIEEENKNANNKNNEDNKDNEDNKKI